MKDLLHPYFNYMKPNLPVICNHYNDCNPKFHLPAIKHDFAQQLIQHCLIKLLNKDEHISEIANKEKFSNDKISILLTLCFTVCLSHGYLPTALIETTIVPLVKNKSGNLSDSNNYRPIALATIVSKILESVILIKCGEYLTSSDNQFGFKSCHSTDLCIYALKNLLNIIRTVELRYMLHFLMPVRRLID